MKNYYLLLFIPLFLIGCIKLPEPEQKVYLGFQCVQTSSLTVQFNNISSSELTAFIWNFGDGNTSTEKNPTHTYSTYGQYDVALSSVYNGQKYTANATITLKSKDVEAKAYFTYGMVNHHMVMITDGCAGKSAVYDFGDGSTKTIDLPYDQSIIHEYTKNGTYTISVTATGANGTKKEYKQSVVIRDPKVYIKGIEYVAVDVQMDYYKAKLVDDDFFTTTWFKTDYTGMFLYSGTLPYTHLFSSRVEMNGLADDDYYTLYIYHDAAGDGNGTQCLKQNIQTATFMEELSEIEVSNNSGNTVVRLLMEYE